MVRATPSTSGPKADRQAGRVRGDNHVTWRGRVPKRALPWCSLDTLYMDFFGQRGSGKSGTPRPPAVRTTVTTKRVVTPTSTKQGASASTTQAVRRNALPEAMQKRIAQDRLEAAQKKAALEASARPRPRKVARTERPARRVMSHSRSVSDDDDDDADDAALDRLARSSASSSQYGTSTFHYHVPRSILPPDGYDPLAPELRATASGPISSRSLVETSETIYVPCTYQFY